MKILHRYFLRLLVSNLLVATTTFILLFVLFDFFDRIDNILKEDVSASLIAEYFLLKIPQMITWVLPIGMLVATLLTIGMLSKNSEFTAMRASGAPVHWLVLPVIWVSLGLSLFSLIFGETVVPYTERRSREIYVEVTANETFGGEMEIFFIPSTSLTHVKILYLRCLALELVRPLRYEMPCRWLRLLG
jgi:lipopolysaccharide export system permease protein